MSTPHHSFVHPVAGGWGCTTATLGGGVLALSKVGVLFAQKLLLHGEGGAMQG